jgi:uncharacterized protein YqgC (DUF456 family)
MLPGIPLVFLGILIYAIYTKFATISIWVMVVLFMLTAISLGVDYIAGLAGASKFGSTKWGFWGGIFGLIVGLIFSPFGFFSLIIGPLLGVIAGELIGGKKIWESAKVGVGTLIGYLLAIFFDLIIAGLMIFIFLRAVL